MNTLDRAIRLMVAARADDGWSLTETTHGAVYWGDDDRAWVVQARHACGAKTIVRIPPRVILDGTQQLVDLLNNSLFSCYCVRPNAVVPCTAQRCDGAP